MNHNEYEMTKKLDADEKQNRQIAGSGLNPKGTILINEYEYPHPGHPNRERLEKWCAVTLETPKDWEALANSFSVPVELLLIPIDVLNRAYEKYGEQMRDGTFWA